MKRVAVLGAGSWGTALAKVLADKGHPVALWARRPEVAASIARQHKNEAYLPDVTLPDNLEATSDLAEALHDVAAVVVVVPSHGLRDIARRAKTLLPKGTLVISATKGVENDSLRLMSEVLSEELGDARIAALGGPSFAHEVARGLPTNVAVASRDADAAAEAQALFAADHFRVYTTDDVVGLELGGAIKNVIALAVGACDGLGLGHNARAGLITRGIAEVTRLATRMGANPQTLAGLGGVGDLVLTCTGDLSRNRRVGIELGRGRALDEVLGEMHMVVEGVRTAKSVYELARREGVDMPITTEVYFALYEGKPPQDAVASLMKRALRPERE
jgi:glycerol-3-phosphate dehydrogenase (NAD(P)+)